MHHYGVMQFRSQFLTMKSTHGLHTHVMMFGVALARAEQTKQSADRRFNFRV